LEIVTSIGEVHEKIVRNQEEMPVFQVAQRLEAVAFVFADSIKNVFNHSTQR